MSLAHRVKQRPCRVAALAAIGGGLIVLPSERLNAQEQNGSAGPLAQSCGVPSGSAGAAAGQADGRGLPIFPSGQYPVKLPLVSLLGARNDLPNPYRPGVSWGTLPEGRSGDRRQA